MNDKNNETHQYDSCSAKGICSVEPRTSSLQEVLITYLKLLAFYSIELKKFGGQNNDVQKIILNTISTLMNKLETANEQFNQSLINLKTILSETKKTYLEVCKENNYSPKDISNNIKLEDKIDLTELIKEGSKEFNSRIESLSKETKDLFEIVLFVVKSLAINTIELQEYSENNNIINEAYENILTLLNLLNDNNEEISNIIDTIKSGAKINSKIEKEINKEKVERFGEPEKTEVSISTRNNNAILVTGNNLIDLENLLEFTKDKNIDIYTNGELIVAHTYPKFKKYPNLIGHYGKGKESCLLDFSSFKGAILITKHSVENIDYLYRGRLFTTDSFVPNGASKIINNDYTTLIEAAYNSKNFKDEDKGIKIQVGYSQEEINEKLSHIIREKEKYQHIVFICKDNHNDKNKNYFKNLLKNMPENTLAITFYIHKDCKNCINLKGIVDYNMIYPIIDKLQEIFIGLQYDISIFISKCDKHTVSKIISFREHGIKDIYLSMCTPIILNPNLIETLKKHFWIRTAEQPLNDIKTISENLT